MTMLIKYEIFSEDITRFYMAEITLAIEAVHKLGFIHRSVFKGRNIIPTNANNFIVTSSQTIFFSTVADTLSLLISDYRQASQRNTRHRTTNN